MGIRPEYMTIGELFSRSYILTVPRYQRGYAWEPSEIDDFLRDLNACYDARVDESKRDHFFGGVVAVKRDAEGSRGIHCDLIDGQQRIATFVLLASCLEQLFIQIAGEAAEDNDEDNQELARSRAKNIKSTYLVFNDEVNRRPVIIPRLKLSKPDRDFFSELITAAIEVEEPSSDDRKSHARLWNAYSVLMQDLKDTIAQCDSRDEQLECLAIVSEILQHDATVINIVTDEEAEAYRLFQVLNDRGTKLSEGDLLRASTLELLGVNQFAEEHEAAANAWDDILSDDPGYTQKFLRWHYASHKGSRPGQTSLFDDFVDHFFPQRKQSKLRAAGAQKIVKTTKTIQSSNAICRLLLTGEWPFESSKLKRWDRERLRMLTDVLDHSNCIPLLLAACELSEKKFAELVHATEKFAFRARIICGVHAGSLQKIYHEHALKIRQSPNSYRVATLSTAYRELYAQKATDTMFGASLLEKLVYKPNAGNRPIKYFLATIEHYLRWINEGARGKPKCREPVRILDLAELTIEHVYPQKPVAANRDTNCDELVNVLGNLTILGSGDNEAIGNKNYPEKRLIFKDSSIGLNNKIAVKALSLIHI